MNKKSYILLLAITAASALALTSCHDDIYGKINKEVTLETNGITGSINSFVRFGNDLYTQNGNVYRKANTPSTTSGLYNEQWEKVVNISDSSSAFYGKHFEFLASDSTYLYGYVVSWNQSTNTGSSELASTTIYYTSDGTTWTAIATEVMDALLGSDPTTDTDIETTYIKSLFSNRALDATNRRAYARLYSTTDSASHVYLLDGGNTPTLIADGTNNAGASSVQAAYYKGTDYFCNYHAFAANDTYLYYAQNGSSLYYADGWDSTNGFTLNDIATTGTDLNAGTIYDIALSSDYILFGTTEGIAHTTLTSGKPGPAMVDFENNASSVLSSSYYVFGVFVLDPTATEYITDIYGTAEHYGSFSSSTSALFDDIGLWAYYPGRGTWNKDGTADDSTKGN